MPSSPSARAADGDQRDTERDQPLTDGRPAGVRHDRREAPRALRRAQRHRFGSTVSSCSSSRTTTRAGGARPGRGAYTPCGPAGRGAGRAVHDAHRPHAGHAEAIPSIIGQPAARGGFRSVSGVPCCARARRSAPSSSRAGSRPVLDKQIELLETFADQAVIAIENARLFTELEARNRELPGAGPTDRHREILRVISRSPTICSPCFEALVESAARLCGAERRRSCRSTASRLAAAAAARPERRVPGAGTPFTAGPRVNVTGAPFSTPDGPHRRRAGGPGTAARAQQAGG